MQKFSDAPIQTCSKCNGEVTKLISQSTFHLKGTGWYVTDYARKGKAETTKEKDTESKPKEDKKSEN
jgi:predicted nucleic acid-binding Zn ribbon protein